MLTLEKIRAELHATAEMHADGDYYLRDKWIDEIIGKYAEQEPTRPCDLCVFNPPSSCDGKPCTMCPAEKVGE